MKTSLTILFASIGLTHFAQAQALPEEAKSILNKLAEYEERELKAIEEEIVKNKKEVIKSLERSERGIKSDGMRKLYAWQINKLKEEVESSGRSINGDHKKDIVDFDVVYYYGHPMKEFSSEKGELTFYRNRSVMMLHKNPKGESLFQQVVKWDIRNGKIVIFDEVHGEIFISQSERNNSRKLNMEWSKLDRTITARRAKGQFKRKRK